MYKPPFSSFKRPQADPMQPIAAKVGPQAKPGSKVYDCPVISKAGAGPVKAPPRMELVDHRNTRMQERNVDRRKDLVTTEMATMSTQADKDNPDFVNKELEETLMHDFWVFPEECTSVYMNKKTGLAIANVCLIGINGRQWPLYPGNNRAPGFVFEALEDHREMQKRFKQKLAPPKAQGRSIIFNDARSSIGGQNGRMHTNAEMFKDPLLGRPNFYDNSINATASQIIRQHREAVLKNKK